MNGRRGTRLIPDDSPPPPPVTGEPAMAGAFQARIIVKIILNLWVALTACGLLAGRTIMSPCFT